MELTKPHDFKTGDHVRPDGWVETSWVKVIEIDFMDPGRFIGLDHDGDVAWFSIAHSAHWTLLSRTEQEVEQPVFIRESAVMSERNQELREEIEFLRDLLLRMTVEPA